MPEVDLFLIAIQQRLAMSRENVNLGRLLLDELANGRTHGVFHGEMADPVLSFTLPIDLVFEHAHLSPANLAQPAARADHDRVGELLMKAQLVAQARYRVGGDIHGDALDVN